MAIDQLMEKSFPFDFRSQMKFDNEVSSFRLEFAKDILWLPYRVLNVFEVRPIYVAEFSALFTSALYTIDEVEHKHIIHVYVF